MTLKTAQHLLQNWITKILMFFKLRQVILFIYFLFRECNALQCKSGENSSVPKVRVRQICICIFDNKIVLQFKGMM